MRKFFLFSAIFFSIFILSHTARAANEATYTLIQGDNLGLPQVALKIDSNEKIHIAFAAQSGANQILILIKKSCPGGNKLTFLFWSKASSDGTPFIVTKFFVTPAKSKSGVDSLFGLGTAMVMAKVFDIFS